MRKSNFALRLQPSLLEEARKLAEAEGGVLNQLITALPLLEQSASPAFRAAVGLLMDTGRRPTEICKLSWDCLDHDSDGKYTLIYTDFKANRAGRRLGCTYATRYGFEPSTRRNVSGAIVPAPTSTS